MRKLIAAAAFAACLAPSAADAFCGFYVNGAGGDMFNDATQVVLMRMGTRTVLSMQNNYKGPPEAFALVIPVPTVLQKEDVKTLPKDVFARVDAMGAPRLVEYWEQDPCSPYGYGDDVAGGAPAGVRMSTEEREDKPKDLGVKIEAQFEVGEYQIVILSATDSAGLDTWLRQEKYQIPAGAEPLLRPYVEANLKFFVAKVDPQKVAFDKDNRAALSPLRFHYDSEEFTLPIRLGLANSSGTQDLIVSILAPNQRYDVSNYKNVTIPTNLDVKDAVKDSFGEFYAALFDRTVEKNPGAVVTEYAWAASTCDPCPGPNLNGGDFATLGADVLAGEPGKVAPYEGWDLVLTRLHARYGKSISEDLVFKKAEPIVGGREFLTANGKLEERSQPAGQNNFQARYAIRHEWTGAIACKDPQRGRWGGPPSGVSGGGVKPALDLAFAPRGKAALPTLVRQDIPEIEVKAAGAAAPPPPAHPPPPAGPPQEERTEEEDRLRLLVGYRRGARGGSGCRPATPEKEMKRTTLALTALVSLCVAPTAADAFCGFYINGAGSEMFNDATQVVLMRKGTRTVLSMQNNYKGPPEAFAMVIPVPTVLHEEDVKTLPQDVFTRVDTMGAPRLVEYWEQDPCYVERYDRRPMAKMAGRGASGGGAVMLDAADDLGVTIEAKFTVGEYQILILSATDSTGLETWLTREKYQIPKGAAPFLRPYIEANMKFFVAKVDPTKVRFGGDGRAALSPLRFHYDSEEFTLPIRLGLANSSGTQDLIVSILSPAQRYEVSNYGNITIPTNLDVKDSVRTNFGAFYAALFDRTVEKNPGAVVTEYAWMATTCDPCPGPQLGMNDFLLLGADVLDTPAGTAAIATDKPVIRGGRGGGGSMNFVLTRLHARYGKSITEDLVFKKADPIVGGREIRSGGGMGKLEERASPSSMNNFQARYAIRHWWTGPITCKHPRRGIWGGPPGRGRPSTQPAMNLAFAPRNKASLPKYLVSNVPEIGVRAYKPRRKPRPVVAPKPLVEAPDPAPKPKGAPMAPIDGGGLPIALALPGLVVVIALLVRRGRA